MLELMKCDIEKKAQKREKFQPHKNNFNMCIVYVIDERQYVEQKEILLLFSAFF